VLTSNCIHRVIQERAHISFIPWQAEEFNFEVGHPRCAFSLLVMYEIVDRTKFLVFRNDSLERFKKGRNTFL
jgi:hypothetical protein